MPMGSTHTLGAELERDRLEHRVGRLAVAVAALRQRTNEHRRGLGAAPRHLRLAIADFEAHVAWREQCDVVWKAYQLWTDSDHCDGQLAHAGYLAALDCEERAARTYADQLECVRLIAT
jgi:hypothetical protein